MWFGAGGNCGCTGTLPTPVVTFDWTAFTTWFPEFSCLTQPQGQAYFDMAGLYCANSTADTSAVVLRRASPGSNAGDGACGLAPRSP